MITKMKEILNMPLQYLEAKKIYTQLYKENRELIYQFHTQIGNYLFEEGSELIKPVLPEQKHIHLLEAVCDSINQNDFEEDKYFFMEGMYFKKYRKKDIGFDFSWNLEDKVPGGAYLYFHHNKTPRDSLMFLFLNGLACEENFEDLGRVHIDNSRSRVRLIDEESNYFRVNDFGEFITYCAKHMISREEDVALRRKNLGREA